MGPRRAYSTTSSQASSCAKDAGTGELQANGGRSAPCGHAPVEMAPREKQLLSNGISTKPREPLELAGEPVTGRQRGEGARVMAGGAECVDTEAKGLLMLG